MSDLLPSILPYIPPAVVRAADGGNLPLATSWQSECLMGCVLFADVSGFTPLTEALARKGPEGPEELTRLLNGYFSRMIAILEREGGEVVKFSGDAVTVLFPATSEPLSHATRRAYQAARAMQDAMVEFAELKTSIGSVALGLKIGIGAGSVLSMQVGGVFERWEYVIAGDPLRQVAEAEHQAQRGDIILSPEALTIIHPAPLPPNPLQLPTTFPEPALKHLLGYLPGAVRWALSEGLRDWLAELRPMSTLFIGVGGLDYEQPDATQKLHTFLRAVQETLYRYESTLNRLAVDDKGTVLLVILGAPPFAHEDDPLRAVRCALDLQDVAMQQELRLAIGVTSGRVFAGPVGGATRREYTVMGDTVNLAARLMGKAGVGGILCDFNSYRQARHQIAIESLTPMRLKGKAGLIRVYRPTGSTLQSPQTAKSVMIGRQRELTVLSTALDAICRQESRVLIIKGQAGIGKSCLLVELTRLVRQRGLTGLLGAGQNIEQHTPYRAWRDIFSLYFELDGLTEQASRQQRISEVVMEVAPKQIERLPLLNDLLNLGLPDNELTAALSPELRHNSLSLLLVELLRTWAVEMPLILVLEDAHWLDSLSWDLALQVARAFTASSPPLLLVIATRPLGRRSIGGAKLAQLQALASTESLSLTRFSERQIVTLLSARLGIERCNLPEPLADLVCKRVRGNPFFAEELLFTLRAQGIIKVDEKKCIIIGDLASHPLPDTVQGFILARIDYLSPAKQLILKVAAVIGRTFALSPLHHTLNQHITMVSQALQEQLEDLSQQTFTVLETPEPDLSYIFKHIIVQEVAYNTLLFAQRRDLHRIVAQWYESTFADESFETRLAVRASNPASETAPLKRPSHPLSPSPPLSSEVGCPLASSRHSPIAPSPPRPLAPYYPLLVHHYHHAQDSEQERHYAKLAGEQAAGQYANEEAIGYFSRALELTEKSDYLARYDVLLAREKVYDWQGKREAQAQDLVALTDIVALLNDSQKRATVSLRQANLERWQNNYPAALSAVQKAIEQATQAGDETLEVEAHFLWGRLLRIQRDYEAAQQQLQHALTRAQETQLQKVEADCLLDLGSIDLYRGNYTKAPDYFYKAQSIYEALNERKDEAGSFVMLAVMNMQVGNHSSAEKYYRQALDICQTIGYRQGEAFILGNLGVKYGDLGDYEAAYDYQEQALNMARQIGDREIESRTFSNLALIHYELGNYELAKEACTQALILHRERGDQRSEGYALTYLGHLLGALDQLERAAEAYQKAIHLRRDLGEEHLVMDDLAGLARLALRQGEVQQAVAYVEEILTWIGANGVQGIEFPLQVYLTCYQVLQATSENDAETLARADTILLTAHSMLQEQAAKIKDGAWRRKFLQHVPSNREIMRVWKKRATTVNSDRSQ